MDSRCLSLQLSTVQHLAQLLTACLSSSQPVILGEHWVNRFIQDHPQLKSKYTQKYDYQHVKYKYPQLIKYWFTRVEEIIKRYGII